MIDVSIKFICIYKRLLLIIIMLWLSRKRWTVSAKVVGLISTQRKKETNFLSTFLSYYDGIRKFSHAQLLLPYFTKKN